MGIEERDNYGQIIFHGGCLGCSRQLVEGVEDCRRCQYFDTDWDLPDLSVKELSEAEQIKLEIKIKYKMN